MSENEKKRRPKNRGNGQGSAYKRGRSWTASVTIGWKLPKDPSKPKIPIKRTKAGFTTKKDALAYCQVLLAGGYEKQKQAPRLSEYWRIYSENTLPTLSRDKKYGYTAAWNKLKPLHDVRIDALTLDIMQTTVSSVAKTYYTQKDCRTVLTRLFERGFADGFCQKDLPLLIEIVPLEEKEQTPFSQEEQKALWKLYEDGNLDAGIPLLMIYTGMMPGEAMLLKTEHIDLEHKIMYGMNLKTKVRKKTPIVLSDSILPVVEDLIAHAMPSGYIWLHSEEKWYARYYAVLEAAGCRKLPPYSCRHTTATALAVDAEIAPQVVKRVMRWSTAKMLDRYAHPQMDDAFRAVNTLPTGKNTDK